MAKAANIKIKLLSTAVTGFFYVTSKNSRTKTDKLSFRKYDPVAKKHVEFKETKFKYFCYPEKSKRRPLGGVFVLGRTGRQRSRATIKHGGSDVGFEKR